MSGLSLWGQENYTDQPVNDTLPGAKWHRWKISVAEAYISCNQDEKLDGIDLDGPDNIYGEADMTQDGRYFNAELTRDFNKGYQVKGSYSLVTLNHDKIAKIGDTLSLDNQYPLKQHQLYLTGTIPLGQSFYLQPAINMILQRYTTVMPQPYEDSLWFRFPVEEFRINSFIGYLAVTKNFNIARVSVFAAYSDLNEKNQFQAGFQAMILPVRNMNFYLSEKILCQVNESEEVHMIFEQVIGGKLSNKLGIEANATFGKMNTYYDRNASMVYNVMNRMKFKGGVRLLYQITPRWELSGEYCYLMREEDYLYYSELDWNLIVPVNKAVNFNCQFFILGLSCTF